MTARISRAAIVGGHDGRAEIEIEVTYPNGGTASISLDEEACLCTLGRAGIGSIEELVGHPVSVVLAALDQSQSQSQSQNQNQNQTEGESHA